MARAAPTPGPRGFEYLRVIRRHLWPTIALTALSLATALFFSLRQTPLYQATTKVLAKPVNNPFTTTAPVASLVNLDTEKEIAGSKEVAIRAAEHVPSLSAAELLRHISISVPANTQVLHFVFTSPAPTQARAGSIAFANAYLEYKTEKAQEALEAVRAPLLDQLQELSDQLAAVNEAIRESPDGATSDHEAERDQINSQIAVVRTQLTPLNSIVTDPGDVIEEAEVPASPSSPSHLVNGGLALAVGLALGVGIAFVRERLDERLRGGQDLRARLGAPVLAVIPTVSAWRDQSDPFLTLARDPNSAAAEAYRTLRTAVLFAANRHAAKVLMVCSGSAGEGKTTTAANLAIALAQAEHRVILLSADLRKPRIHHFFNVSNRQGLVNVLAGELSYRLAAVDVGIDGLRLLPAGTSSQRPAEMLGSEAMGSLLDELRVASDFVIVDTAPLLVVSDALSMARFVDGVLLVADSDSTGQMAVSDARTQLEQVGARIIGGVLNNFDPSKGAAYYRSYHRDSERYGTGVGGNGRAATTQSPSPDEPVLTGFWE